MSRAVATPHFLATESAVRVLDLGGSAADAAIAGNAVLCVAYPHMAGLGGDGFWLVWDPADGSARGINGSGPAAGLASGSLYASAGLAAVPERGPLAALTVPGAVDGWRLAHERWGRLPWDSLLEDAIRFAYDGVPVAGSLARYHAREREVLGLFPAVGELYSAAGDVPAGGLLVQPALGAALRALGEGGAREFYEGAIGTAMADALERAGSPLRAADFAAFRAEWVEPVRGAYRGHELLELPPNTQGIAAIQILRMLEGFDVAAWGDGSADYIHAVVEATKLAFADRDAWVTDPRYVSAPLSRLASAEYAETRRALIRFDRSLPSGGVHPGIPFGAQARRAAPTPATRDGDTCYFCVVDDDGLAVSCIQSIYHAFGSMVVAGDTGVVLQNRGVAFSLDLASANVLEPGKRPFHTLIPAMLLRDGAPYLVFGSMGGEGQPQTQAALVTRIVDFGYDARLAVDAPRWLYGRTWGEMSRGLALESRFEAAVAGELARRGHEVRTVGPLDETMGHAQVIVRLPDGGLEAAADPRGDGSATVA